MAWEGAIKPGGKDGEFFRYHLSWVKADWAAEREISGRNREDRRG
jgi:hypothetical protein